MGYYAGVTQALLEKKVLVSAAYILQQCSLILAAPALLVSNPMLD
jgi:hypothetical protein